MVNLRRRPESGSVAEWIISIGKISELGFKIRNAVRKLPIELPHSRKVSPRIVFVGTVRTGTKKQLYRVAKDRSGIFTAHRIQSS